MHSYSSLTLRFVIASNVQAAHRQKQQVWLMHLMQTHLGGTVLCSATWHCLLWLDHRLVELQQARQHAALLEPAGHLELHWR